jgi:hypothetical protein
MSKVVDIYNAKLGEWNNATISVARSHLAATSLLNLVLFAGGKGASFCYLTIRWCF